MTPVSSFRAEAERLRANMLTFRRLAAASAGQGPEGDALATEARRRASACAGELARLIRKITEQRPAALTWR